ncbi:MAG: hypothetical protein EAS52_25480 [Parapedobacter sp.]|nr:MAG: hypothetical protein EAS52_25480 [Parapedobacter sp.]
MVNDLFLFDLSKDQCIAPFIVFFAGLCCATQGNWSLLSKAEASSLKSGDQRFQHPSKTAKYLAVSIFIFF